MAAPAPRAFRPLAFAVLIASGLRPALVLTIKMLEALPCYSGA